MQKNKDSEQAFPKKIFHSYYSYHFDEVKNQFYQLNQNKLQEILRI